ncbi:MAG: SDR family NAD(P)-dependent oxidoreductase [Spirochaetales bacterium]|nr:SDR family NAD(P)-dependent oxidoreductase [Spirochaetales bacterium]
MVNRNAIITGGSRGIGRAIVYELAKQGYDLVFNYFSNKEKALEIVAEISKLNRKIKRQFRQISVILTVHMILLPRQRSSWTTG